MFNSKVYVKSKNPSHPLYNDLWQMGVLSKNCTARSVRHPNNNINSIYIFHFNFYLFSELLFGTLLQQFQSVWLEQLYQLYNVCNSNKDDVHILLADKD